MKFADRVDAGKQLAQKLEKYKNGTDVIVLGLARGGVVIAYEVARALGLAMDIKIVRKIGAPSNPELAVGALTASGTIYLNKPLMNSLGVTVDILAPSIEAEKKEALRRWHVYCGDQEPLEINDKTVILVDDGIATGASMEVAIQSVALHGAKKIVVAAPIIAASVVPTLTKKVSEVVSLCQPIDFWGIGQFYDSFEQVSDDQIVSIMQMAR
jgi:putative phosphoribosyl transferase